MPKYKKGSTGMTKDDTKGSKMTDAEFVEAELFRTNRAILIQYLQVMMDRSDWHGVSDAANDLRVLEAEYKAGK
jgi:hypothetical protein